LANDGQDEGIGKTCHCKDAEECLGGDEQIAGAVQIPIGEMTRKV
jgi:hypothetical protein